MATVAPTAAEQDKVPTLGPVQLYQSLCGFTDRSLQACGRFYSRAHKTGVQQLAFLAQRFASVEVDSTLYMLPSPQRVAAWCEAVPAGFTFHFKAYAMFCSQRHEVSLLPRDVRFLLSPAQQQAKTVDWHRGLPQAAKDLLWERFNTVLRMAHEKGKLGVVLFQFHTNFAFTKEHVQWLQELRRRTLPQARIAFEFRNRRWFDANTAPQLVQVLRVLPQVGVCAADELCCEMPVGTPGAHGTTLPSGAGVGAALMPIALLDTGVDFFYIRLHRREGESRVISHIERQAWRLRLRQVASFARVRDVYFLWGTAHEDQGIRNMTLMEQALSAQPLETTRPLCLADVPWREDHAERHAITRFFTPVPAAVTTSTSASASASVSMMPSAPGLVSPVRPVMRRAPRDDTPTLATFLQQQRGSASPTRDTPTQAPSRARDRATTATSKRARTGKRTPRGDIERFFQPLPPRSPCDSEQKIDDRKKRKFL